MSAPRFTVLMPTHYRPDSIGFAIEAVLKQTEQSLELLVVGDGAAPETAELVKRFDDPRIRWFDLPKAPGYGYANRNIAMAESRGELVAYASDDDLMLPDHLERLGALFDEPQVQWAYSQTLWVSTDGIAGPDLTNLSFDDERQAFEQYNTISGGALVFRASAFPSRQCWPEDAPSAADWQQMRWLLRQYGLAGMRRLAEPTFLHFVAGRKGGARHSDFPLLAAWLNIADNASWWPRELKPDLAGQLPQAHYAWLLETDPALPQKLRSAAIDLANRVALEAISPRTAVNPAIGASAGLEAELAIARQERGAMQQQRDDMQRERDGLQRERDGIQQALQLARTETQAVRRGLQHQLDAMRNSTIWRAAAPLRAVMHRLRGKRVP